MNLYLPNTAKHAEKIQPINWTPKARSIGRAGLVLAGVGVVCALTYKSFASASESTPANPIPIVCTFSDETHSVPKLTYGYEDALLTISGINYGSPCYPQALQKLAELNGYTSELPYYAPSDKPFIVPNALTSSTSPKSS